MEEERTRRASVLALLRASLRFFAAQDPHVGFYGAFGYDVVRQLEDIRTVLKRSERQRDVRGGGAVLTSRSDRALFSRRIARCGPLDGVVHENRI